MECVLQETSPKPIEDKTDRRDELPTPDLEKEEQSSEASGR